MAPVTSTLGSDVDQWQGVRELWGDALQPIPAGLIPATASPDSKAVLTQVGLPTEHPLDLLFYFDERLLKTVARGGREYFAFGEDGGVVLLATEAGRDEVINVQPDGPQMFVNSSIADFLYSYGVFAQREEQVLELPYAERGPLIGEIRDLINARDPEALDPDGWLSWWESLLGQYEEEVG
jgi:hypothetical protein